ncbi:Uncharacterised protein [Mycoplasmopsis maculosa]|uniref:Lipoprotein n=1 Tax=Mycoplasmopsis maculosa TaxID=114885 RepID=A0A449B3X9_9BACT|nr:hypothetical protein [Mycoplasmopsis maculosa]VEU75279.1 Uncharacterised protein [Mycoplasmopsis maculosa]
MKNNKKILRKLFILPTIVLPVFSIISCANYKNSLESSFKNIIYKDINEESASIFIELDDSYLKENNKYQNYTLRIFNKTYNKHMHINSSKIIGNKLIFNLDDLNSDSIYKLEQINYLNDNLILENKSTNLIFKTLKSKKEINSDKKKENYIFVNDINFNNITNNTAEIFLILNDYEFDLSNLKLYLKNGLVFNATQIQNEKVIFNLNGLKDNTEYTISKIILEDKELIIEKSINKVFVTKELEKEEVIKIKNIQKVSQHNNVVNLRFDFDIKNKKSDKYNIEIKFYDFPSFIFTKNLINTELFELSFLNKSSNNLSLEFIKINGKNIDFDPFDINLNENNDIDKLEKEIELSSISLLSKNNNSASIQLFFENTNNSEQYDIDIKFKNINSFVTKEPINKSFTFNLSNLDYDTEYILEYIKINNKKIDNLPIFTFRTDNLSLEEPETNAYDYRINESSNFTNFIENDFNIFTDINDENIKSDPLFKNYFNFLSKNETTTIINEKFIKNNSGSPVKKSKLIDINTENNTITYFINIDGDIKSSYILDIERKLNNNITKEKIRVYRNKQNIYEFKVDNLVKNEEIKILSLLDEEQVLLNFEGTIKAYKYYGFNNNYDDVMIIPTYNWELFPATNSKYSISFDVKTENQNFPSSIYLKYIDSEFNVKLSKFSWIKKINSTTKRIESELINKEDIKKVLGLSYKISESSSDFYDLKNVNKITKPEEDLTSETNVENDINLITVENNKVIISYSSKNDNLKNIQFLVKSLNLYQPYSKKIVAEVDNNSKTASFDLSLLPKNISKYMITASNFDEVISDYSFNSKYKFTVENDLENISINSLKFIKNENEKRLYASASLNISNTDYEKIKNKWFEFTFEPILSDPNNMEIYQFSFIKDYKVIVPIEKIWKFGLNGFYENIEYELKKVKIVEPYILDEYYSNINIDDSIIKKFVYKFDYSNVRLNKKLSKAKENNTTNNNSELITQRKDLTFNDLIGYWLSDSKKNKIPYSVQNHYALVEFEKFHYYKKNLSEIKEIKRFELVDENNNIVNFNILAPREILDKTVFKYNENKTEAILVKDLEEFKNLDEYIDDLFFVLRLELDTKKRVLSDLNSIIQTESKNSKSFVNIAIPYKELILNKKINDLPFTFFQARGNRKVLEVLEKEIADKFIFSVVLTEDKKMEIKINSRRNNVKLLDFQPDHYFSLSNSAFLGNTIFYLHWVDLNNKNINITYKAKPLNNNMSIDLDKTYLNNSSVDRDTFLNKNAISNKADGVRRLYKEDSNPTIESMRKRTFSFNLGTWSVIGKVKPKDKNDHRYYVVSNQHVWRINYENTRGISENGNEITFFKNNRFVVPKLLNKPENLENPDKRGFFENRVIFPEASIKLEAITDFGTDSNYPSPADIRDNFGNIYNDETNKFPRRADFVIAIADMSFFFNNFSLENLDEQTYNNRQLDDYEKTVVRFFLNWENLPMLEASRLILNLNESVNLNWYFGTYPSSKSYNKDSLNVKRYREYIFGNIPTTISRVSYLGSFSINPLIEHSTEYIDTASGSSGTTVYDSSGNIVGFHVQGSNAGSKESGTSGKFVIDGHKYSFFGRGDTPQAPGSFYERMKLFSYLYPDKYDISNFSKTKKDYFD